MKRDSIEKCRRTARSSAEMVKKARGTILKRTKNDINEINIIDVFYYTLNDEEY